MVLGVGFAIVVVAPGAGYLAVESVVGVGVELGVELFGVRIVPDLAVVVPRDLTPQQTARRAYNVHRARTGRVVAMCGGVFVVVVVVVVATVFAFKVFASEKIDDENIKIASSINIILTVVAMSLCRNNSPKKSPAHRRTLGMPTGGSGFSGRLMTDSG